MRILVLADVPPGTVGGAEVQAWHLARQWAANGHAVLIAGVNNVPRTEGRVTVVRLPLWQRSRLSRGVSYLLAVMWLVWRRRGGFEVVYCRFIREQAFAASFARALGLLGCPVVVCPACAAQHGDVHRILRSSARSIWVRVLRRGGLTINAMSRQIREEIPLLGLADARISDIPNGVLMPELPPRSSSTAGPWKVLFLGRLVEQKGADVLLDAAQLLRQAGHDFVIEIVGDGPLREVLSERVASLGLEACVRLIGAKAPDAISDVFLHADVFVLPSRYEGMPGVLLQALAYGLPVIATRVSGSEDIVSEDMGWLVPVDDPGALADAFQEAFRHGRDRLRTMGARGRALAARVYDNEVIARRYERLFEELIESSHNTPR